ncbi:permease-like cell division protein FtsX [Desulfosporosinus sp.]|uniref:permease-like cell division protein FtsX n=1 Tax=Desulfosporosinus sp. TaxID=157907 RepID=UPI000E8E57EF|nr:permease-like cell division protein FtsX [Desulfosporosinus sp.]MBC2722305.1 ABC transporter permease [Desulfosporosinus sp.]MBC2728525.1 ABC transporter permease [Desulfosporosinus sp.]HBV86762.1 cell division protein [Desulfosporosinus sp.]
MMLDSSGYILRETINSMRRNPWLSIASVITVMVSLVILGYSVFFLANASNMAKSFESELEIATFVQISATPEEVQALKIQIEQMQGVDSVTLVTKEQALEDFGKTMGGEQKNILADLGGTNPFPDKLTVKAIDPQNVIALAKSVGALPGVDKVRYGQGFVDQLLKFTQWLRWIGFGVVAAFGVAAIVLISINVKMNVFSRRREIQIMKLVGASNSFIRWPFLIEGMALGLVGGALAALIVGLGYNSLTMYVQSSLTFLPVVQNEFLFRQVSVGLLLAGMAMGALGSGFSLQKFLRT